jgi:nucleotide-binding universal stress UspA family protein
MKNILVPLDFDKEVQRLIDTALEFAEKFHSKIWVIHVAAPDPEFIGYDVGPQYIRDNRAEKLREEHKLLQKYTKQIKASGIEAEALLIQGRTLESILDECTKLNIDLAIIGHHKHSNLSLSIIKKSKIPVLIIPFDQ